ncbi:MAG: hypothetical protein R3Y19_06815 [Rikenellaceae bacterium]
MDYQSENDYDYDYDQNDGYQQTPSNSTEKGLKIAIYILLVVLLAVGFLYWRSVRQAQADEELLKVELDTLQNRLGTLRDDMSLIEFENDTLNQHLGEERHRADSLFERLKSERSISYSKLKAYERELGTLRATMQTFVRQIDSLNTINKQLAGENLSYRRELSNYRVRTEAAEEMATELSSKITRGAVIRARDIQLTPYNKRNKDVTRVSQAKGLRVSLVLSANELATPGEREIYVAITNPEGMILAESQNTTFNFEGETKPYTVGRTVDYVNDDLGVSLYYNGSGLTAGQYTVLVYMDDSMIGTNSIIFR